MSKKINKEHGSCGIMLSSALFKSKLNHKNLALQIIRELELIPLKTKISKEDVD
jgi:hypothetical protein